MNLLNAGNIGPKLNNFQQNSPKTTSSEDAQTIEPKPASTTTNESKIAIIDDFAGNTPGDFDNDGYADDTTHGKIVSSLAGDKPQLQIQFNQGELVSDKLKGIREQVENGENISAVNVSIGYEMSYDELSKATHKSITPENIKSKAPAIISAMRQNVKGSENTKKELESNLNSLNTHLDSLYSKSPEAKATKAKIDQLNGSLNSINKIEDIVNTYDEINKLADLGVPVVISSGNKSKDDISDGVDKLNLLTLNEKAITVGSTDQNNHEISSFSQNNSLVDINMQGVLNTQNLPQNITNNLSFTGNKDNKSSLEGFVTGTSFSAPQGTKFASQMHDKGLSVDQMNNIFKSAESSSIKSNKKTSSFLESLNKKDFKESK